MDYKIVDTTLRDGEQMAGFSYNLEEKLKIARYLDFLGIYQIEAGTAVMGGEEKESIYRIKCEGLKSKISSWNRLKKPDVKHSMDCGVDIIHISAPSSSIQLRKKLNRDEKWLYENVKNLIYFCREKGFEVTVGFEDASRADMSVLKQLCRICTDGGVKRVRYADTVGILTPGRTIKAIRELKAEFELDIEIHAHNDFGMAVANSVAALKAGAQYINCTLRGIGERSGNCDYYKFIKAVPHDCQYI
ncbi:MAG: homocitrate synthase [Bacillota bacterium]|nr:homocitrate synthase [Bacillota bacterium]